jgi:tetratricopeptide (TPR) repeat protein
VDRGFELLSSIDNIPRKLFAKLQAYMYYWKGCILWQIGDFDNGMDLQRKATVFAEGSGDEFWIAHCYIQNAATYFDTDDYKKGLELLEKGKELANKLGNKFLQAFYYQNLAIAKSVKLEFKEAIDSHKKALTLSKEIGSSLFNSSLYDIGLYYRFLYKLDDALQYFEKSLKHLEMKHGVYYQIGIIHFLKYELEQAQRNLLKSMEISEKIGERRFLSFTLYNLVRISLELHDEPKANEYLIRLKEINDETGYTLVNRFYRFASILVLKESNKIEDLAEAVKLLNSFLDEPGLSSGSRLDALFLLAEIRIKELQLSASEEALEEAKKQAIRLEVEASEQKLMLFLGNVIRLQSQLALVELDINKAIEFLDKAQSIADEINIELLKKRIQRDREKIDQQLVEFKKFQEQKTPLSETVKFVSLENTVQNIKKETIIEERDEETGKIIEYRKLFSLRI